MSDEAEKMAERLDDCDAQHSWGKANSLMEAAALIRQQAAEIERLREDAKRLDFLDWLNRRLNARYGTSYGWKLITSHNVNRLMLGSDYDVDLHDSEGGNAKLPSCRGAIDERMREVEASRARAAMEATDGTA